MIKLFFLFCCFALQPIQHVRATDASWYKNQIIDTVIPPFSEASTTLNDNIIQKLVEADVDSDETAIRALIDSLVCASRKVQKKLSIATKASEDIRNSIDHHITQLVISITDQERNVHESQNAVNQANNDIQHTQEQVRLAEVAVQDKQHAFNVAERDRQEAQDAVDRARLCGRRRRKRGFGKWWRKKVEKPFVNAVRQTVIKPACSVLNSGGIDNAKNRRALAERSLTEARQRLAEYQQSLAHQRNQYANAQTRLTEAQSQLNTLTAQLHEGRAKQVVITSLVKQLKDVEVYLNEVLDSSSVLKDAISQLVDFEHVIEPLNTISDQMATNIVMSPFTFKVSTEISSKMLTNLNLLAEKMPKMPLNAIEVADASINCA